jgi:hypothetical protein
MTAGAVIGKGDNRCAQRPLDPRPLDPQTGMPDSGNGSVTGHLSPVDMLQQPGNLLVD